MLLNFNSEISEFYKDKSIFLTGATGFLGKALIEKLLRSCSQVKTIYVLVRKKKGKSATERLFEIVDNKLFSSLYKINPDFKKKLVAIEGDLELKGLGISEQDRQTLRDNVNIVFHSAATVRFDEPLKVAVCMNILGVKQVIELCKEIKNLTVFIHVSTAYANCDRRHVSEEVYNSPIKPEKLLEAVEWIDEDIINYLTPKVIGKRPNTYTFTKAIAESLVVQECKNIPCAIVRPSIVGASWKEPIPGWIDNFNGPTALFPATGSGLLKSMLGVHDAIADIIPVDIPVNLMIASAWFTAVKNPQRILVYNCTSGQINKLTWGMLEDYGVDTFYKYPFENIFFVPNPKFTPYKSIKYMRTIFEQILPAYLMDFILKIAYKKPFFVRVQKKISKAVEILEYFTTKDWEFTNDNFLALMNSMNDHDKKEFYLDIRPLNWKTYIEQYCLGAKIHLLKEDISNVEYCRRKLAKMQRIQSLILYTSIFFIIRYLYQRSTNVKMLFLFLFKLALKLKCFAGKMIQNTQTKLMLKN